MLEVFAANSSGWENLRGSMYVPETSKFDPTLIPVWLIAVSCITLGTLLSGHQAMGGPQRIDRQQGDNDLEYNHRSNNNQENNVMENERPLPDLVRQRSNSAPPIPSAGQMNQVEASTRCRTLQFLIIKHRERSSPTE